jgi:hypothetical protein
MAKKPTPASPRIPAELMTIPTSAERPISAPETPADPDAATAPPAIMRTEPPAPEARKYPMDALVMPLVSSAEASGGYVPKHVDVQLDANQGLFLARLVAGLDRDHARLLNGRAVQTKADTIRWLLERCAELTTDIADSQTA